jgi:hypothetical protein
MNIDDLFKQYWFHDGLIKSFYLDIEANKAVLKFYVNRIKDGHSGNIEKKDLEPCYLELVFENLMEISLFDKLPTMGYYLSINSSSIPNKEVEMCINVHDSSNHTYEKDNWKKLKD